MRIIKLNLLIYLFVTLTSISKHTDAQFSGTYVLNNLNKPIECYISFYENGIYLIELSDFITEDIQEVLTFSYGNYSRNYDELKLIDKINGYRMTITILNNELEVKNSFKWMVGRKFIFLNDINEKIPDWVNSPPDTSSLQKERNIFKESHKTENSFLPEIYEDCDYEIFTLTISSNNTYKIEFRNLNLSDGKWSKRGNELIFLDTTLTHQFYILVDTNVLISKLLPGDQIGYKYVRKNIY